MARFDLGGRKGLVVGIANEHSIAWGCARAFRAAGAERAVTWFNDALEASTRYLAAELGPRGIRVKAVQRAPLRRLVDVDDVGALCVFLAGDGGRSITGSTLYVDAGFHIVG